MKEELINQINQANFSETIKLKIINSLTPRFVIEKEKTAIRLGDSKIGGYPHLPVDLAYPQEEDYFYEFVGQINLAELKENEIPDLPANGMLYFFIDDDFNVGNVNTKVIYLPNLPSGLEVKHPPKDKKSRCESFSDRTAFTELRLTFRKDYTIDQWLLTSIENELVESEDNKQHDFKVEKFYTNDQIGGFTTTWGGGEAAWSAYLAKKRLQSLYWFTNEDQYKLLKKEGIEFRPWLHSKVEEAIARQREILLNNDQTLTIYPYWQRELADMEYARENLNAFIDNFEYHKAESKKWKMLLSLSSENEAQICFGDGKMEFFIHAEDLAKQDFRNVFCHIYN